MIDHLVVTAPSLAAGVEYVKQALGVAPQPGGEHQRMGTHNCLLRLGDEVYLEVISVNPMAPPPGRPRWFELDKLVNEPRLATWVARTNDIRIAPAVLGNVESMSWGNLSWRITIPADGSLPLQGLAPTLIQWETQGPAAKLEESGCSLIRLEGFHPEPATLQPVLQALGLQKAIVLEKGAPRLVAHIQTPSGTRKLR